MKKSVYLVASMIGLAVSNSVFAQTSSVPSETSLYNEISSAYNTGFFPGVIEKSSVFEANYSESAYIFDVRLQKASALVATNQNSQAVEQLNKVIDGLSKDSPDLPYAYFLLGKAHFQSGNSTKALAGFMSAAKLSKGNQNQEENFNQSVLFAGRIYYSQQDFKNAVEEFEYVVSNGKNYNVEDYKEALQKLLISYINNNQNKNAVDLFNKLNTADYDSAYYYSTAIYVAKAYENLNENKKAYDLYCEVINSGIKNLSVVALKKAYRLADEKKFGVNPAEIFERNAESFKNQPQLVCDFWTRLAIDEFDKEDYKTSKKYLQNAENLLKDDLQLGDKALISLYKAKILLKETDSKAELQVAKADLEKDFEYFLSSETDNIVDSYYSTLLQFYIALDKWNELLPVYEKITKPDAQSVYIAASVYYKKSDFLNAKKTAELCAEDAACKKIIASCLLNTNNPLKACQLYSELDAVSQLDDKNRLEYAKALFLCNHFSKANSQAELCKLDESYYISGLCLNNLQSWSKARDNFNSYIKTQSSKANFNKLAFFYKGYAEYNLSEFKNSYLSFVRYTNEEKNNLQMLKKAYDFATKSALQNLDFKNASIQAENLVKISFTQEEKQSATLLVSQIYLDSGNYDKAIEVVIPYVNEKSDFSLQALFQIAKVYEKQEMFAQSEENLNKIISKAPKSSYAEEALYHAGEIYYSVKDYATAENRFNKYVYKYADGKFLDSALFYCSDCDLKLGLLEKSITFCDTFLKKYEKSPYIYGVYSNLLNAYYESENYENALETAKSLLTKFPEQAADDGVGKRANELQKIVSGSDKRIALKQVEYERLGKTSSKEGRKAGSELVMLYWGNNETQKQACDLAYELIAVQESKKNETEYYAKNLSLIAEYNRKINSNKTSAETYLKAALAFRECGKIQSAAESLYSAVDAFIAADQPGDAKETAKTLKDLYSDSVYAQNVDRVIGN